MIMITRCVNCNRFTLVNPVQILPYVKLLFNVMCWTLYM